MPRVIHFEIHADDPERAVRFYQGLFDWQFQSWGGPMEYWLIQTGSPEERGIDGGLIRRQPGQSGNAVIAYVCTIDVPALDDYVQKALATGGQIAVPKMPIPGIGWLAYCKDPEGNIFGMMQSDPDAE
jgi:predicted enzyme related to lactoylglutathione lyase